eukprot:CAMPEP_0201280954 /NCGR_PEP_ID=MMETSP1317-20130820/32_1 /ASSEMBLY_ACC=CAM_ASM_000770 /TAXON_ID=187299 /ORGANISM="Undescribed Undescribed, Strain Undescribed" /LENGTH=35 /DNA_ID= /DNA_START= /DNA_END= /DNA_ORIENTATION=
MTGKVESRLSSDKTKVVTVEQPRDNTKVIKTIPLA